MEKDGTFENITKKERLLLSRERERLRKVFGGIETMTSLPGAIFVIDAKREHLAVKEARNLGIPVIGVVDTNTDPDCVDYPIPANDDSLKTANIITSIMADAIIEAASLMRIRVSETGFDQRNKEGFDDEQSRPQKRMRERGDGSRFNEKRGRGGDRPPRGERNDGGDRPRRERRSEVDGNKETGNPQTPESAPTTEENP
jgi:small subunit ribosomal protein S2